MASRDGKKADWLCRFCERGHPSSPLSNNGSRSCCRGCSIAKGSSFLRNDANEGAAGKGKGKGKGKGSSLAERQVRASKAQDAKDKQIAALKKKLGEAEAKAEGDVKEKADKEDCSADDEAAKARSKRIEGLQAAVSALEPLPGQSTAELATLRLQLAELRQARDSAKPVANRLINAKRLVEKRVAAASKATVTREKAEEALVLARKAVEEATAAETAAHKATAEAHQELHQLGISLAAEPAQDAASGAPNDVQWDTITAVLTQLHQLPAAMAAGNGNAAWLQIQENGLQQLQAEAERRATAKLQKDVQQQAPAGQAAQPKSGPAPWPSAAASVFKPQAPGSDDDDGSWSAAKDAAKAARSTAQAAKSAAQS